MGLPVQKHVAVVDNVFVPKIDQRLCFVQSVLRLVHRFLEIYLDHLEHVPFAPLARHVGGREAALADQLHGAPGRRRAGVGGGSRGPQPWRQASGGQRCPRGQGRDRGGAAIDEHRAAPYDCCGGGRHRVGQICPAGGSPSCSSTPAGGEGGAVVSRNTVKMTTFWDRAITLKVLNILS